MMASTSWGLGQRHVCGAGRTLFGHFAARECRYVFEVACQVAIGCGEYAYPEAHRVEHRIVLREQLLDKAAHAIELRPVSAWRTGSDRLDLSAPAEMCLLLGLS